MIFSIKLPLGVVSRVDHCIVVNLIVNVFVVKSPGKQRQGSGTIAIISSNY